MTDPMVPVKVGVIGIGNMGWHHARVLSLDLDLPEASEHHTLAGFLLERLQHIPAAGEALRHNGVQFEIITMRGPRIVQVRLVIPGVTNR